MPLIRRRKRRRNTKERQLVFTGTIHREFKPRPELFVEDGLHMTRKGYKVWTEAVKPLIMRK